MSAPICLRSAFGACRPKTTHHISIRTTSLSSRTYADKAATKIKGVPRTSSKEEQKTVLDSVPETAPPVSPAPQGPIAATPTIEALTSTSTNPTALTPSETTEPTKRTGPKLLTPNVVAAYRAPLKHTAQYGVPVASLQLRSFSVRSLEFFADFALRAAYYLNLPASGPVPLPKRIERWTTLKSNFVNKKAQENFERITYKRLITIMDGEKSAVEVWLAVLRKWQFWGVGMKANVWEWEGIDVAAKMDAQGKEVEKDLEAKLANFGWNKGAAGSKSLDEMLRAQIREMAGSPMSINREKPTRAKSAKQAA